MIPREILKREFFFFYFQQKLSEIIILLTNQPCFRRKSPSSFIIMTAEITKQQYLLKVTKDTGNCGDHQQPTGT